LFSIVEHFEVRLPGAESWAPMGGRQVDATMHLAIYDFGQKELLEIFIVQAAKETRRDQFVL
jgi:hypothetical protein